VSVDDLENSLRDAYTRAEARAYARELVDEALEGMSAEDKFSVLIDVYARLHASCGGQRRPYVIRGIKTLSTLEAVRSGACSRIDIANAVYGTSSGIAKRSVSVILSNLKRVGAVTTDGHGMWSAVSEQAR